MRTASVLRWRSHMRQMKFCCPRRWGGALPKNCHPLPGAGSGGRQAMMNVASLPDQNERATNSISSVLYLASVISYLKDNMLWKTVVYKCWHWSCGDEYNWEGIAHPTRDGIMSRNVLFVIFCNSMSSPIKMHRDKRSGFCKPNQLRTWLMTSSNAPTFTITPSPNLAIWSVRIWSKNQSGMATMSPISTPNPTLQLESTVTRTNTSCSHQPWSWRYFKDIFSFNFATITNIKLEHPPYDLKAMKNFPKNN